jgi:hypothetical protein
MNSPSLFASSTQPSDGFLVGGSMVAGFQSLVSRAIISGSKITNRSPAL